MIDIFELLIAVCIGLVFGYLLRKEQQPPVVETLQNQVKYYEKDIAYYKKLTKGLVEENAEMREQLRKNNV